MDPSFEDVPMLAYKSVNEHAVSTIVLIHGAFVSGQDWDIVTPHLSDYHILAPDLPSHGGSRHLELFSVSYAADMLHRLIQAKAINRKAHIVGHSLGAYVAIALASSYPNVVCSVVVSGYQRFTPNKSWLASFAPRGVWLEQRIESLLPRSLIRYLMDGTEMGHADLSVITLPLCGQLVATLSSGEQAKPWPAPTLVIAATKGGIIPSLDTPKDAIKLAEIGRKINSRTMAVKHEEMRHPWNRQAPELFAATIRTWINDQDVPEGFIRL